VCTYIVGEERYSYVIHGYELRACVVTFRASCLAIVESRVCVVVDSKQDNDQVGLLLAG
jgi:hypothetical protein